MIVGPLERFDFLVELELDACGGISHLTSLAQSSSVYVACSLVATEGVLEVVLEVEDLEEEEMVMVVEAVRLGAKEDLFE